MPNIDDLFPALVTDIDDDDVIVGEDIIGSGKTFKYSFKVLKEYFGGAGVGEVTSIVTKDAVKLKGDVTIRTGEITVSSDYNFVTDLELQTLNRFVIDGEDMQLLDADEHVMTFKGRDVTNEVGIEFIDVLRFDIGVPDTVLDGLATITLNDNLPDALSVIAGSNNYITLQTTTGDPLIRLTQEVFLEKVSTGDGTMKVLVIDPITNRIKEIEASAFGTPSLEQVRVVDNELSGDIDFNENGVVDISNIDFFEGESITWNDDFKTLNIPTGEGANQQAGHELYYRIHNNTGQPILNGQVVIPQGVIEISGVTYPTVILAKADKLSTCNGLLLIATHDIDNGREGSCTRFGRVGDLDTSSWTSGGVWLSDTVAGALTNVKPVFPSYTLILGGLLKLHATEGIIGMEVGGRVQDTMFNALDGSFRESLSFTVDSDGAIITGSLERSGGGDLTMILSDGMNTLDCTPAKTIVLTAGTDTDPQKNYVYIPESTKVLTVSTSDWPTVEHIKVANLLLRSATSTQTDDALINRNWNDHVKTIGDNGHIIHMAERLRVLPASWYSGTEGICTIASPTASDVHVAVTGGKVYQLHQQAFPALDTASGDAIHIINDFVTPLKEVTNLNAETTDSLGNTLTNKSFTFILWGVQNDSGETCHLMVNKPRGSYAKNSPDSAVSDALNYADYTIPSDYNGVGFLIAAFTYQLETNGTDWTLYNTKDLRGHTPNTAAGGGGGGGGGVTTYLGLTDTDSSYAGQAKKVSMVGDGEAGLELNFVDHVNVLNKGSNTHAQLDTHLADATIHFIEGTYNRDEVGLVTSEIFSDITIVKGLVTAVATRNIDYKDLASRNIPTINPATSTIASGVLTINAVRAITSMSLDEDVTSVVFSGEPVSSENATFVMIVTQDNTGGFAIDWTGSGIFAGLDVTSADLQPQQTADSVTEYWFLWHSDSWTISMKQINPTAL